MSNFEQASFNPADFDQLYKYNQTFSAAEQKRYADHDFDPPMRCPDCRRKKTKLNDHQKLTQREDWKKKRTHNRRFKTEEGE